MLKLLEWHLPSAELGNDGSFEAAAHHVSALHSAVARSDGALQVVQELLVPEVQGVQMVDALVCRRYTNVAESREQRAVG